MRMWRRALMPSAALVTAFVLLGFAPLAILATSSIQLSKRAVERGATARVLSLNASFAALIADAVDDVPRVMTNAGQQPAMRLAVQDAVADPGQAAAALQGLLRARPDLDSVFMTDPAGRLIVGEPGAPGAPSGPSGGGALPNPYWLAGAAHSDQAYVSKSYLAPVRSYGQVVAVAMRVTSPQDANQTVGYLVGVYRLTDLQASVDQLQKAQGVRVTVTDQAGVVLSTPGKAANKLISLASDPRVDAAIRGGHGVVTAPGPSGSVLSAYGPVAPLGWTVSVDVPERVAYADYYSLRETVLIVAAILALLMTAGLFLAGRAQGRRRALEAKSAGRSMELAASEQRFRAAFVHAPVGMVRETLDGDILEVNRAFCEMLGMTEQQLLGRNWQSLTHPDDLEDSKKIDASLPDAERSVVGEKRYVHSSGEAVWGLVSLVFLHDSDGERYVLAQVVEISDRKRAEAELSRQALHDSLTGLPNRVLAESRIEQGIARSERDASAGVAVLFIDLDGFKGINDRLGHQIGDQVLREIGWRIEQAVRPEDTVARLGGDEFLVVCEGLPRHRPGEERSAERVAARVLHALARPGDSGGQHWQVSASIGISYAGVGQPTPAALIAAADAAMYDAKQDGKNRVRVYQPSMVHHKPAPGQSVALVSTALAQNRLTLRYQPLFDLRTRSVVGVEALLRMQDVHGQLLLPAEFLPAARAHGQMVDFGGWVLRQACADAAQWRRLMGEGFTVGVNVSAGELEDAGFLHRLDRALQSSDLPAEALVIEITESAFLRDLPAGRVSAHGLRERGVKIALDDFGTGFSSLSYLRRNQVDFIKIDCSFTADLDTALRGARVTKGLIALAQSLETAVVAEGVETEPQADVLRTLGVAVAQGRLLAWPMPADEFSATLAGLSVPLSQT